MLGLKFLRFKLVPDQTDYLLAYEDNAIGSYLLHVKHLAGSEGSGHELGVLVLSELSGRQLPDTWFLALERKKDELVQISKLLVSLALAHLLKAQSEDIFDLCELEHLLNSVDCQVSLLDDGKT